MLFPRLVRQGPDAYGWMSWSEDTPKEINWFKSEGRADSTRAVDQILSGVDNSARWFVGHTRWATVGTPKKPINNHPVEHGNVIGVHNGTLYNYKSILDKTGRHNDDAEVDSEAIFAAVDRWGPTKGLSKVSGTMVTVYTRMKKPWLLHVARSYGRQLHIGWTKRGNMIFASEPEALCALEPLVRFKKFSTIGSNRLLVVKDGQIIQRHQFNPKTHRSPLYKPQHKSVADMTDAEFDRWLSRDEATAQRRGAILFPEHDKPKPDKIKREKDRNPKKRKKKSGKNTNRRKPASDLKIQIYELEKVDGLRFSREFENGEEISEGIVWFEGGLVSREEYEYIMRELES